MRLITAVRIYYFALSMLVIGWISNLILALRRPVIDWRDAAGTSSLVLIFITVAVLRQARRKLKQGPDAAIKIKPVRYILMGSVVALAVVSLLFGFLSHR